MDLDLSSGLPMVDMKIWNKRKGDFGSLSITVDTGANITTISTDILVRAGYDVAAGVRKSITTASGREFVRAIIVPKIKLGRFELNDVLIYAHTFPQESFSSGVLGINVLEKFDVNILFSKKVMILTKHTSNTE